MSCPQDVKIFIGEDGILTKDCYLVMKMKTESNDNMMTFIASTNKKKVILLRAEVVCQKEVKCQKVKRLDYEGGSQKNNKLT